MEAKFAQIDRKFTVCYAFEKSQIGDTFIHNVIDDQPLTHIIEQQWDYMVMGEIIEHVDNPVLFLQKLKEKYTPYVKQLVITAPNAFEWANVSHILKNMEVINSDHRFIFTPYTLAKVATRAGFSPTSYAYCNTYLTNRRLGFLLKRIPMMRESVVMTMDF